MPRSIRFKILRYALVPFDQIALDDPELPDPKGRAIEAAIVPDGPPNIFVHRGREFAFVGFNYFQLDGQERFLVGTLAKKKSIGVGELRERSVVEISTADWIPVWVALDVYGQYIAVEMNGRFGSLEHVVQVLQSGLKRPIEEDYRQDVVVSPVTDARRFWEIIDGYERVYRVSLRLVSPNFLESPARFRRLLGRWKSMYNQTQTSIELKNEEGELQVTPENLEAPINYISVGEGSWSVEVAQTDEEERHYFSSQDETETFSVEVPRASRPAEELEAAPDKERSILYRLVEALQRRNGI